MRNAPPASFIMAPTNPHVISQLRHLIYYHLDNDLPQNALFLAGRLHAYDTRSVDSTHLVALCQLRLGQPHLAYESSKLQGSRGAHLGCAYVFAQACLLLPHHQKEGITALERSRGLWGGRNNWSKSKMKRARYRSFGAVRMSGTDMTRWARQAFGDYPAQSAGCGGD